jgi:hypothetical protein
MSRVALPFVRPAASVVDGSDWSLVIDDDEVATPASLDDWDYNTDLHFRRTIEFDSTAVREQSELPSGTKLAVAVVWRAAGSGVVGRGAFDPVAVAGLSRHSLDFVLPGAELGGHLELATQVVLAESLPASSSFSPHRAGSVLWEDTMTVRLQGDASQFPMAVIDFGKLTSLPVDAGWHLQINGELHSAAMGTMLLLINERNLVVSSAFRNAAKPRPVDYVTLSAVYADVARTMIEHALSHDDFGNGTEYADGSLGAAFSDLFEQLFPGQSVEDIRLRRQDRPSIFASEVQAAVHIFAEQS